MTVETCVVIDGQRGRKEGRKGEERRKSRVRKRKTNKLIRLRHIRRPNLQPILTQILQRLVIQHDHTIRILSQPLKRQHAVVRLNDDVGIGGIGEDGVGLDEFFGEDVGETFENVGAETGTRTAGDGVEEHDTLRGLVGGSV